MTPAEWKVFYARERAELGDVGLRALFARAPEITCPPRGAVVFPHTRLRESGHLVAAAARAAVRARTNEVLAIGVLHAAPRAARRVHGDGAPDDERRWTEEFSLDNFTALIDVAARDEGVRPPRVVARFPFLVGDTPDDLAGLDELRAIAARGAFVVATTDPLHHGIGSGTPRDACHPVDDVAFARATIEAGFELLARRAYADFARHAAATQSDFRDAGPTLAAVLEGALTFDIRALELVDYSETLAASHPTWVAAALTVVEARS